MNVDPISLVSTLVEAGNVDTMFDGYLIRTVAGQVRLQALVGGDARYGGLYDLLGVGRDYDSDRLIARFAVVHRERMVAW